MDPELTAWKWIIRHILSVNLHAERVIYVPYRYVSVHVPGPETDFNIEDAREIEHDSEWMRELCEGLKWGYHHESRTLLIGVDSAIV